MKMGQEIQQDFTLNVLQMKSSPFQKDTEDHQACPGDADEDVGEFLNHRHRL